MQLKHIVENKIGRRERKILDQILHIMWAFIVLLPIVLLGLNPFTCALSAMLFAIPRELVDQWPISNVLDSVVDVLFFGVGGFLVGLLI